MHDYYDKKFFSDGGLWDKIWPHQGMWPNLSQLMCLWAMSENKKHLSISVGKVLPHHLALQSAMLKENHRKLYFWRTNLHTDRQQGGSDCVALGSAGWPLAWPLTLLWCLTYRLLLLAAVQQDGLDTVSISQEERMALSSWHVPNPKPVRQLQRPARDKYPKIWLV